MELRAGPRGRNITTPYEIRAQGRGGVLVGAEKRRFILAISDGLYRKWSLFLFTGKEILISIEIPEVLSKL